MSQSMSGIKISSLQPSINGKAFAPALMHMFTNYYHFNALLLKIQNERINKYDGSWNQSSNCLFSI